MVVRLIRPQSVKKWKSLLWEKRRARVEPFHSRSTARHRWRRKHRRSSKYHRMKFRGRLAIPSYWSGVRNRVIETETARERERERERERFVNGKFRGYRMKTRDPAGFKVTVAPRRNLGLSSWKLNKLESGRHRVGQEGRSSTWNIEMRVLAHDDATRRRTRNAEKEGEIESREWCMA